LLCSRTFVVCTFPQFLYCSDANDVSHNSRAPLDDDVDMAVADSANTAQIVSDRNELSTVAFHHDMHQVYATFKQYLYAPKRDAQLFPYLQSAKPLCGDRNFAIVDKRTFLRNFRVLTGGLLDTVNWRNVVVAGGAVLACLTHADLVVWFSCLNQSCVLLCVTEPTIAAWLC